MNGIYNTGSNNFSSLFSRPTQFSFQRPVQQNTFSFQQPAQQSFSFGQNTATQAPTNSLTSLLNALTGSLGSIFGGSSSVTPSFTATAPVQQAPSFTATAPTQQAPANNTNNVLSSLFASLFGGTNNIFGGSSNIFGAQQQQAPTNSFYNAVAPAQGGYNGIGVIPSYNNFATAQQGYPQQGQQPYQAINYAQTNGGQIQQAPTGQMTGMGMTGGDAGVGPGMGHDFLSHVRAIYPTTIAPGQAQYGGFTQINDNTFVGRSVITGMQPVIEQAIYDIVRVPANRKLDLDKIESKVAERLTQLNDFSQLRAQTRDRLEDITGENFSSWSKAEREESINHLLHSPLPFGNIQQVMSPNQRIDLGYTHTLDKDRTVVKDLGNGIFQIKMISNNNNGSHTGHNLGTFRVQLAPGMTLGEAKDFGNRMIVNTNNNAKLYLAEVARAQLMDALADY